jgi:hypothetical protein
MLVINKINTIHIARYSQQFTIYPVGGKKVRLFHARFHKNTHFRSSTSNFLSLAKHLIQLLFVCFQQIRIPNGGYN